MGKILDVFKENQQSGTVDRIIRTYRNCDMVIYHFATAEYDYSSAKTGTFGWHPDNLPLWDIMSRDNVCSAETANSIHRVISDMLIAKKPQSYSTEYRLTNADKTRRWYRVEFVCIPHSTLTVTFTDIDDEIVSAIRKRSSYSFDELTNLYVYSTFCNKVQQILYENEEAAAKGEYAIVYFDVQRFKAINDMFGMEKGNNLIIYIGSEIEQILGEDDIGSHIDSDKFVFFTHKSGKALVSMIQDLLSRIEQFSKDYKIICNAGVYITNEESLSANAMVDRAILAHSAIKGGYTVRCNIYNEEMRKQLLTEQDIVSNMGKALEDKQFVLYYQPQFNHSNGSLVGTEALVRWIHPERGVVSPGIFIPIFEKTGFITNLDLYVFEQVCAFLRKRLDEDVPVVPISSNFSRYDIFMPDFVGVLEKIRMKYNIPVRFLRVEITESAVIGGSRETNEIVRQLHEKGYIVEMDDFGSGYSSLNVLKDIDLDIIKLDLRFLAEETENNRGGTIISSVIRMAKWLSMPVIAEGVETVSQADFLKSIGCDYIQGYLYSKPIPEDEYIKILTDSVIEATVPQMRLVETLNACNFWDPKSQETLIFSNYVGSAAIFDYHDDQIELLRVNQKYLNELGMNLSEYDLIKADPLTTFTDETDIEVYKKMITRAIESGEEEECETWRTMNSSCCGTETICIRSNIRMIGKSKDSYLFYAMIRNITASKRRFIALSDNDRKFRAISEQANIYSWEFDLKTRDMHPCYRCMRDLGLPPVVHNYPEPAIEASIFPPEVADDYREWLKQLDEGVEHIEKIYPLTIGRIPFHVRYTTEFDESGKPIKAMGSATLVVDH